PPVSMSAENASYAVKSLNQRVYILACRVYIKRGASRRRKAEAAHQWLGAVVTGADGDAFTVQDGADVVRMDAFHRETQHAGFVWGSADHASPGDFGETL